MTDQAIQTLFSQGIAAVKAGSKVAEKATAQMQNDAKDPDLRAALEQGNQTSQEWMRRIQSAATEIGGVDEIENQILEAPYEVSRKIRQDAQDDQSRDLGIIASGQMALHYWIAAFGTLKTYAGKTGLSEIVRNMASSLDDAKQADQADTDLTRKIMAKN